ncbi:FecCD family ABC transporter permease [Haliangium ochraceum]|uniref:Transport system permease protein n=1 Tax=Haliangium ochraceum (strain DSM 14365 / JCM 11303 / SMP-2) TaxID=502025 RepID=D0LK22_HALO1|nr:iron ABC transporter permease [Haliangium ochraceum]ACY13056.1 transport system permease protein [Haliangium ochraceum DSM 14365]
MSARGFIGASAGRLTRGRLLAALALGALLTALLAALAPLLGVATSGPATLSLLDPGALSAGPGSDAIAARIFWHSRLPRVLAALLVGSGLAAAGCAFQAVLRNPLAEPFTLGISSGSALAAVIAVRLGWETSLLGGSAVGLSALAGAGLTVVLVWLLSRVDGTLPPATMLLAGITISMFCSAASLLVQYTADFGEIARMIRWMMGGLDWIGYQRLARAAVPMALGLAVMLALARSLNAMSAGPDAAASVGVDASRTTAVAFVVASLLVGAGIALAGPIGFVGLLVPHALRALVGPDHRVLLPMSMLAGGALLVVCDTLARLLLMPDQLPVGVVTALLGGPFFLFILLREKRRGGLWS